MFANYVMRRGDSVYKTVEDVILPVLWRDHKTVERSKQVKLTFLANELGNVGRHIEAHVVRTIVKPYIRDMNRKWSEMTAIDKLKTCDFKKQPPYVEKWFSGLRGWT